MSNKQPKIKKERAKSVPMNGEQLEQIHDKLIEADVLIGALENPAFIESMRKNVHMAIKKVNGKLFGAKKKELLTAIREGKNVQIVG